MSEYLVISALGEDQPGIVNRLSKAILEAGGNIAESRMSVLGGEFALILMIEGKWSAVASIENQLPKLGERLNLTIISRRTARRSAQTAMLPYRAHVISMDHPGIVHEVTEFFSGRGLNIEEMNTETYHAPHTGTPMFSLDLTVSIPATLSIADLRDDFGDFCDEMNLDATFEADIA